MPELPEVETVRRGLQPVMEGARFTKVEARRPDLRRPFPKNFAKRLQGAGVIGLGRRAKYLLADLTSGDVLLMPEGVDRATLESRSGWIADLCKREGFRFCPRLHILLYGNVRGT